MQLAAGGDAELGEHPVQVVADRPVRDEQLLADLAVGQPLGSHPGDLKLLRRQLIPGIGDASAAGFPRCAQFLPGDLGQLGGAERVKTIAGRPQRRA
jgi:hypothetical protein